MGEAPQTTDEKTTVVHRCPLSTTAITILIRKADHQQKTHRQRFMAISPKKGWDHHPCFSHSFLCLVPNLYNSVQLLMVSGVAKLVYRRKINWKGIYL